jgi:hypothetical protein
MSATSSPSTAALVVSQRDVNMIIILLIVVALVIVIQPFVLSLSFRRRPDQVDQSKKSAPSFFEIPFITWFLVHYGIAALAVIAIVILGLDNVIDKSTVAALLGSLFGYVLGSSSKGSSSQTPPSNTPGKPPSAPPDNP